MEALDDQKPIVEFTKPGRDTKATKVEEVFTELRAEDDFGVNQLELYYSVNGSPEQKIELFTNKGESPKEISASHTFFLEEHDLQPGDFITYYGKAVDSHRPPNTVSTDIYFIEVRPFGREYYQGQQGGGGGGGGEGDGEEKERGEGRGEEQATGGWAVQGEKEKEEEKKQTHEQQEGGGRERETRRQAKESGYGHGARHVQGVEHVGGPPLRRAL